MAYIFTIIFISKLVSVEMACPLGIQNEIQAVCANTKAVTKQEGPHNLSASQTNIQFFLFCQGCIKQQINI